MRKVISLSILLLITLTISGAKPMYALQSTTAPHKVVTAASLEQGKQFRFSGLPISGIKTSVGQYVNIHGVQTFSYTPDNKYIFTTSQCETGTDGKYHTLLSRCSVPSNSQYATCTHSVVLEGYGHGDSISISQRNPQKEEYDIWVACSATSGQPGTEIARITYRVTGTTGKIIKRVILRGFEKTNISNGVAEYYASETGNYSVRKMMVYADSTSNQIAFRVNFVGSGLRSNYVVYDLKALNTLLDRYGDDRKFAMSKAVGLQKANIKSSLCPLDAFQSFAIDGKTLYLCGGNHNIGAQIYTIPYSITKNGKNKETTVKDANSVIDIAPEEILSSEGGFYDMEVEGLQIKRNGSKTDYYINYYFIGNEISTKLAIYKFTI